MFRKPLKQVSNQPQLSEFQRHFLNNMAEPPIQIAGVSVQVRNIALERRKLILAQQPVKEMLASFIDQLKHDNEFSQQFNCQRLQLSDFDDEQFTTRPIEGWLKLARNIQINDTSNFKGLYATCYDLDQWQDGYIIGTMKDESTS